MSRLLFTRLPLRLAVFAAFTTLAGTAAAQSYSAACVGGPNVEGQQVYWGCITSDTGYSGSGGAQTVGDWGVGATGAGPYRGGEWQAAQEANLATGVLRSSLLYASGEDPGEYLLNTYTDLSDELRFSGNGSAEFVLHLTGAFLGAPHAWYPNGMDTSLDFYSLSRQDDTLGRVHLAYSGNNGLAQFTPGTTCGSNFALGPVSCTVHSLAAGQIGIDLHVRINGITDGEVFQVRSALNLQVYGPRGGGADFGHTARLEVLQLEGVSFTSASGAFLTSAVPEPGTWLQLMAGLGALGAVVGRRGAQRR